MKDLTNNEEMNLVVHQGLIKTVDIYLNTGQITGLPANHKYINEAGLTSLRDSITEEPEYLMARPLIVIPYAGAYVVIAGNSRLKMCIELHILEVPCIVLNEKTPSEKLKRYMIKDNVNYGKWDWDMLANEFDANDLQHWGVEIPFFDTDDNNTESDGDLKIEQFKLTLDCGTDHELYNNLKLQLEPLLAKLQGVEVRG